MRCVLADNGWVDPKSIHVVADVFNTGIVPLIPLVSNIHGCFSRARLMSGQILEDQLEAARVAEITYKLYPKWHQEEIEKMGFSRQNNATAVAAGLTTVPTLGRKPIAAGGQKKVWWKPNFGLFTSQNKLLPTAWMPLTFEYTLQSGQEWCDTTQVTNPAQARGRYPRRCPVRPLMNCGIVTYTMM